MKRRTLMERAEDYRDKEWRDGNIRTHHSELLCIRAWFAGYRAAKRKERK